MFYYSEGIQTKTSKWKRFSPGVRTAGSASKALSMWFNPVELTNEGKPYDRNNRRVKPFDKTQHPFVKTVSQLDTEGNFFQVDKEYLQSPIANIILHGEKTWCFPAKIRHWARMFCFPHICPTHKPFISVRGLPIHSFLSISLFLWPLKHINSYSECKWFKCIS